MGEKKGEGGAHKGVIIMRSCRHRFGQGREK